MLEGGQMLVDTGRRTKYGTIILNDGDKDILDGRFRGKIELNRSKRWDYAETYQEARDKSPSTRPVR